VPASTRLLSGRYRLDQLLGEGAMASVWQAHDERLGRDVAIKVVRPDAADPAAVARFHREARVVAGLRHPGVVLAHDYGVEDGSPFLVMELLSGPSGEGRHGGSAARGRPSLHLRTGGRRGARRRARRGRRPP
jgi:Protein kinase domain